MKTYKIDPLGKNRPLMLVRGTRLPESFPDSVAEHMAKSLKANCRGVFATINGEISSSTVSPGVVMSKEANEDNNTLVVMTEGMQNQSVEWEDSTGKQFRLEHAGRFAGSQDGGNDPYYTGAYKDLRTFVTGAVPYTGQPLVAANAKQWYSYTTPEGVALTFRGCIQAPVKGGTDFVGLKIDSIKLVGSPTDLNYITLDCDSAVSLGLRNGMNDNSKPFNMSTGIGWLQIVVTDAFKSNLYWFNESTDNGNTGNGDAVIDPDTAYDGFTYNVDIRAINRNVWVPVGNDASFRVRVKEGSALENSIVANASGFACESLGVDMSGSGNEFPMAKEVSITSGADPAVINLTTDNRKQIVVIRFPSVQDGEQLHLDLSDTVTVPFDPTGSIKFYSMSGHELDYEFSNADKKSFILDIPSGDDVFACFRVDYTTAGTLTLSRVIQQPTPGFYDSEGHLVKSITKKEVEKGFDYGDYPANVNEAVKTATNFVWPEGVTEVGWHVFKECTGLTSLTIPEGVTEIGSSAFEGCTGLTSLTIPEGVTEIGSSAFEGCTGLTSVTIPEGVTEIIGAAFSGCTGLTSVTIPDSVTSIGGCTFEGCTGLTSVTIPDSATSISNGAFRGCSGLTSVTIHSTVTSIGLEAFQGCTSLNPLVVPNTVTTIGMDAFKDVPRVIYAGTATGSPWGALEVVTEAPKTPGFYNAEGQLIKAMTKEEVETNYTDDNYPAKANGAVRNATKFVWPDGVTKVGDRVFYGCKGLTSVTIPSTVTSIGEYAFKGCSKLTSVTIPNTVTSIEQGSFTGCSALTSVTIPSTVTSIEFGAFQGCTGLTSVTIPEGVTSISSKTFDCCTGLTSVTIPSTVTSIGFWAFQDCTSLNPLVVPNTVTTIDMNAFKNVPKVIYGGTATGNPWGALEVVAPKPTPGFYGADGQLIKAMTKDEVEQDYTYPTNPADANVAIKTATKFVWPDGVTKVGNNTFYDCSALTSVTIPEGVTSIGNGAFGSCSKLTSVSIPSTVTSIGNSAFSGCSGLTSVTIPEGVTSIGNSTFSGCTALTEVTIPNTVTSIGSFAFKKCTGLNPLTVPNTVATIGSDAFKNVPKVIYGGQATGTPWGALEVVAPTRTPGFYNSEGQLIKAMTKEEVEQDGGIGDSAIVDNATEFVWPEGVTKLGSSKLAGFKKITSVEIPDGVTSIGYGAFGNCSRLASVTIPSTVASIGDNAFHDCMTLTSITIPEGVTSIGETSFKGCSKLTSVTIPNTVTSIGMDAFHGCSKLTSVSIPSTVTSIGNSAFYGCSALTSVAIPEGVTSIGNNVFSYCSGLTSVTIPSTVTSIGNSAFSGCTGLNPLVVPNTVATIGMNAFWNIPKVIYGGTATGNPWGALEVVAPSTPDPGPNPDPGPDPGPGPEPDPEPTKDPGFYSADGQLVKAMTKEEVEQDYNYRECPSATTQTIKNATKFVWPEGVTKVGNNAFYECSGLTELAIPEGVTSIGNSAFDSCSALTSVTIPSTVTSIGNGALSKCSKLTSVSIPSTVTSISNSVLSYCTGLTSVVIPEGVTSIGNSAFSGCTKLTSVTIPSTVTSIGQWAFKKCSALNPLTVPNTVTTIGKDAFMNVPKVIYSGSASGSPWGAVAVAAS